MEVVNVQHHASNRRKPLGDGSQRANSLPQPPYSRKSDFDRSTFTHSSTLPHRESLAATGPSTLHSVTISVENKRLSAVTNEGQPDSKRSSQVSTTSTTASGRARRRKKFIGHWELGSDIGKGGCGSVRKVRHRITGDHAAAKIVSKKTAENVRAESLSNLVESSQSSSVAAFNHVMPFGIEREVVIMKLLEHPNIVKLYDVWENRNELYLIMEYVDGGELFDYVAEREYLEEDETVYLFRQILAALLHCNRLRIHHRDLKPENILLDLQSHQVKLVDFGMAALQPKGGFLTTPCGSIHYAAPEVFQRKYDGEKIDVWSLGVILYVMLTGTTPFVLKSEDPHGEYMQQWYLMLRAGNFPMPDRLSAEAKDLIRRMLQPDSTRRISLKEAWKHPLVHKYEKDWGEPESIAEIDAWIGPSPIINDWSIKDLRDIDREILRNLRTLWHSEKEESLLRKILSPDANQEKYFYYALQKHREEQLENYIGEPEALEYSASDYHHIQSNHIKSNLIPPPLPPNGNNIIAKSKSQFSILNDEHLQSTTSLFEPPRSETSYDPYRTSRNLLPKPKQNYTNVTVHNQKRSTASLPNRGLTSDYLISRQSSCIRIETLKRAQRRISTVSSNPSLKFSTGSTRKSIARTRTGSKASIISSNLPTSPPISFRPSVKYKRPVNFSHLRRSSTATALGRQLMHSQGNDSLPPKKRQHDIRTLDEYETSFQSPEIGSYGQLGINGQVVSKKEGRYGQIPSPRTKISKSQSDDHLIDSEARKVSTELEKYCEELFNRSSRTSSHMDSEMTSRATCDTPPSSVSNRASDLHSPLTPVMSEQMISAVSAIETPNTVVIRELTEMKKRLEQYAVNRNTASSKTYSDILAVLNTLLQPAPVDADQQHPTSPGGQRNPEYSSQLPAISEEDKTMLVGAGGSSIDEDRERHMSKDPTSQRDQDATLNRSNDPAALTIRHQNEYHGSTIRLIDPTSSSPSRPAPLNIRKNSIHHNNHDFGTLSKPFQTVPYPYATSTAAKSQIKVGTDLSSQLQEPFSSAAPHAASRHKFERGPHDSGLANVLKAKRRGWWRMKSRPTSGDIKVPTDNSLTGAQLSTQQHAYATDRKASPQLANSTNIPTDGEGSRSFVQAESNIMTGMSGKRPGFLRFLWPTAPNRPLAKPSTSGYDNSANSEGRTGSASSAIDKSQSSSVNHRLDSAELPMVRDLSFQRSWFARFLHLKPATRVVCLETTRGRARVEIIRLLRGWRAHGLQDVLYDDKRNVIFARLDAVNTLHLKAVEFIIELFVVLEGGRRKGLSIARFTQRKGAASSLRRIAQEIESRLASKRLLVQDREMRKEMEAILTPGVQ